MIHNVFANHSLLRNLIFSTHPLGSLITKLGKRFSKGAFCFHIHTFSWDVYVHISSIPMLIGIHTYYINSSLKTDGCKREGSFKKYFTPLWTRIIKNLHPKILLRILWVLTRSFDCLFTNLAWLPSLLHQKWPFGCQMWNEHKNGNPSWRKVGFKTFKTSFLHFWNEK